MSHVDNAIIAAKHLARNAGPLTNTLSVACSPEMRERVVKAAKKRGLTIAMLGRAIYADWLDENEPSLRRVAGELKETDDSEAE